VDVQKFVTEALVQICNGVNDASELLAGSDAIVNPGMQCDENNKYVHESYRRMAQVVEFDLAVTVKQGSETEGGAGLMVGALGLGTRGRSDAENTLTSRIRFTVPLALPQNVNPTNP